MPKRLGTPLAGPRHPLTDGPLADPQRLGNLALGPALLLEVPGLEPPGFFPVVRYGFHAWQSTTESLKTLVFNVRVSRFSSVFKEPC